ncbi:MAG: glycosyltransferase family 87 protein [Planctomycetota bacterium]
MTPPPPVPGRGPWRRSFPPDGIALAWCLWVALFLVLAGITIYGNRHSVTVNYREGARHWFLGLPLYSDSGAGYIYFPHTAIVFAPFAILPEVVGDILWRVLAMGIFAGGIRRLTAFLAARNGRDAFLLATLASIAVGWSAARNGQTTLPLTGMMLLAVIDLAERQWGRAALWLCLGLAFKPSMVVPILLAAALYRPVFRRLAVGLGIFLLFPFLTQAPAYVASQYALCAETMPVVASARFDLPWAQVFGLLEVGGVDVPRGVQTGVRLAVAVVTLLLCAAALRRRPAAEAALFVFTFAALYILLFGPRTENNTYAMAGPTLGIFFGFALWPVWRPLRLGFRSLATGGIVGSYEFGRLLAPEAPPVWLAPACTLALAGYAAGALFAEGVAMRAPES